jgi:hypothetical protein
VRITPAIVDEHEHRERLDATIPSFLRQLESAGYAKKTCRDKRAVLSSFADWLPRGPITVHEVNESHVAAFLKRTPRSLPGRMKFERAALCGLLKYLRRIGMISSPTPLAAPPGAEGAYAGPELGCGRCAGECPFVSLAVALSRALSDADGGVRCVRAAGTQVRVRQLSRS